MNLNIFSGLAISILLGTAPLTCTAQIGNQPRTWEFVMYNGLANIYIDRSSVMERLGNTRVFVMMDYDNRMFNGQSSFAEWVIKCRESVPVYKMSYIEVFYGNKLSGALVQGGRNAGDDWTEPPEGIRRAVCG